jgi:hypothetical protein
MAMGGRLGRKGAKSSTRALLRSACGGRRKRQREAIPESRPEPTVCVSSALLWHPLASCASYTYLGLGSARQYNEERDGEEAEEGVGTEDRRRNSRVRLAACLADQAPSKFRIFQCQVASKC